MDYAFSTKHSYSDPSVEEIRLPSPWRRVKVQSWGQRFSCKFPIPQQANSLRGSVLIVGPGSSLPAWGRMKDKWWWDNTYKLQFVIQNLLRHFEEILACRLGWADTKSPWFYKTDKLSELDPHISHAGIYSHPQGSQKRCGWSFM